MNYAIITGGIVTNIIIADAAFAASLGAVPAQNAAIGWSYAGGVFTAPVPPALDLAAIRLKRWEDIKALRDQRVQSGGYTTGGKWFHSDTFSRTQQMALVMMGAGIPPGLQWKTMDGSFVAMTQALAGQVFAAGATQDATTFAHAEALRTQVNASSDPAAVEITAGWPTIFQPQL